MQVGIVFLFLAPYAVAVVMPSWRWLLVYAVVVGGLLTAWFAGIATAPMRTGMEGIGLLYIVPIAASTAAGTLIRHSGRAHNLDISRTASDPPRI